MPALAPFRAIRYDSARAGRLAELIAPPYDVIGPEQREKLAAKSPYNMVHLILEKDRAGDGPGNNKYIRAGKAWAEWRAGGILKEDAAPCIYPLEQAFTAPDGRHLVRRGFLATCRIYQFKEGMVLPHEKTLAGPKADRLELIRQARANLSPIFGLYPDERKEGTGLLGEATRGAPAVEVEGDDGVTHRLWQVSDERLIKAFQQELGPRPLYIADGHHRYETALAYRDMLDREKPGLPDEGGHRYVLMFFCAMSDPGLVIFPTHRLLHGLPRFDVAELVRIFDAYFRVETLEEDVRKPGGRAWAMSKLGEHAGKSTAFLMITAQDKKARIVTLRDDVELTRASLPRNETVRALDVSILHGLVFEHLLGLSAESQARQENLKYVKDAGEAVSAALEGEAQAAFLVNPTPMWQVRAVGEAGETMPQKSTFFYPKLASGLVMRAIDPDRSLK